MSRPRVLVELSIKVLRRIQFYFPFTLGLALLWAFVRWQSLRSRVASAAFLDARDERDAARNLMLRASATFDGRDEDYGARNLLFSMGRASRRRDEADLDLCLLLDAIAARGEIDKIFSVALVGPGVRSIALYWNAEALSQDVGLWHRPSPAGGIESLRAVGALDRLIEGVSPTARLALPAGALREAQALLKRYARRNATVCLNLDHADRHLPAELVRELPALTYLDLSSAGESGLTNLPRLGDLGLTMHERLAMVGAADVYVGRFDELGAAALLAGTPAAFLGHEITAAAVTGQDRGGQRLWLPSQLPPDGHRQLVDFIDRHARAALRGR